MKHYQLLIEIAYLRGLLLEGRMDFLTQKYIPLIADMIQKMVQENRPLPPPLVATGPNIVQGKFDLIANKFIDLIAEADPDANKKNTQWLLNLFVKGRLLMEDLGKATEYLTLYQRVKAKMPVEQRDLNKYQSLTMLYDAIEPYQEETSARAADRALDAEMHKQAKVVFNDADYKIVIPLTQAASCHFGTNTQWCTAATNSWNAFEHYNKDGPLYVILDKKNNRRWQYHPATGQFMDERDRSVNKAQFASEHPKVAQIFADMDGQPVAMLPTESGKEAPFTGNASIPIYKLANTEDYVGKAFPGFGRQLFSITVRNGVVQQVTAVERIFTAEAVQSLLNQLKLAGQPDGGPIYSGLYYRKGRWGTLTEASTALLRFPDGWQWRQVRYKHDQKSATPPHKMAIWSDLVLLSPEQEAACYAVIADGDITFSEGTHKNLGDIGKYIVDLLLRSKVIKSWSKDSAFHPSDLDEQDAARLIARKPYLGDLHAVYKIKGPTPDTQKLFLQELLHLDVSTTDVWIFKDTLAVRQWENIDDCIDDMGNRTAKYYAKLQNGDEQIEFYDIPDPESYTVDQLLSSLKPERLVAVGRWLGKRHRDIVKDMDGAYDPADADSIRELYRESDDDELKSAFTRAYANGLESGAMDEASRLLKRGVDSNKHIFFFADGKWTGDFTWDAPVALGATMAEILANLDELPHGEWEEILDAKIEVDEPYNGLSDYSDDAAAETFSEEVHELLPAPKKRKYSVSHPGLTAAGKGTKPLSQAE